MQATVIIVSGFVHGKGCVHSSNVSHQIMLVISFTYGKCQICGETEALLPFAWFGSSLSTQFIVCTTLFMGKGRNCLPKKPVRHSSGSNYSWTGLLALSYVAFGLLHADRHSKAGCERTRQIVWAHGPEFITQYCRLQYFIRQQRHVRLVPSERTWLFFAEKVDESIQ